MRTPDQWLRVLHEIADQGDAIALRLFRAARLRVDEKADGSPVTEADQAIESAARKAMTRHASEAGILGEEQGDTVGSAPTRLIVDPIDATRNFIRGIPIFATLLAIEENSQIVAGVVSAPALGIRWHAARGNGAWSGSRPLRVSQVGTLSRAQLFHGNIHAPSEGREPNGLWDLAGLVERTRGFGDFYQHALVAQGSGEIAVDPRVSPWDVASLQILVEEAGGRATTLSGERTIYGGSLVTSNGLLHDECLRLLTPG
jgi:histidinol-phosphatase